MGNERVFKTAVLTEINRRSGEVAEQSVARGEGWKFFCECGNHNCHELVVLSLDRYLATRADGGAVLAPGHRLSRGESARRQAKILHDDSQVLRAQANNQRRRAKKQRPAE